MQGSSKALASVLATAGLAFASLGGSAARTAGQLGLFAQAAERQAPTPGAIGRQFAQADARKRFVSGGSGGPARTRPRSTGSHKQNRRRAMAGR